MSWLLLAGCGGDEVVATVDGCDGPVTRTFDAAPTWDDVSPLVAEHCVACHAEGGVAGIRLDTHAEAARWAPAIADAVADRRMPPYPGRSCPSCTTYRDARWLPDDDAAALVAWASGGAEAGEGPDTPLTAEAPLHLGSPDETWRLPAPYTPDPARLDDYHCFRLDAGAASGRFVTALEVLPDQLSEVHHVLVYATVDAAGDLAAAALDEDVDGDGTGDGWRCDGGPGVPTALLGGWAPGTGVLAYPADTGLLLPEGREIVVQIHYNTGNGVTPDRTAIALGLADTVPHPAQFFPIAAVDELVLPPGEPAVEVSRETTIANGGPGTVWGAAGHMHGLGTALTLTSDQGGCGLDIPRWDFDWQLLYFFDEPYLSAASERVRLSCTYDTTGVDHEVRWGESTTDEMCIAWLYVTAAE